MFCLSKNYLGKFKSEKFGLFFLHFMLVLQGLSQNSSFSLGTYALKSAGAKMPLAVASSIGSVALHSRVGGEAIIFEQPTVPNKGLDKYDSLIIPKPTKMKGIDKNESVISGDNFELSNVVFKKEPLVQTNSDYDMTHTYNR